MGAPRKHPPKNAAETIQTLAASGHSIIGIASKLAVSKDTFKRWLEDHEELQDAFDLGRETERQFLHSLVVESAKKNQGANVNAFFILKARHGYVEADKKSQQVDVSVAINNVMYVKDHGSDKEWERKAAEQQRRLTLNAASPPATVLLDAPSLAESIPAITPPTWNPRHSPVE